VVDIIDDEGRLLGAVNIIDALVVLLVLAVTVAGVALVFGQSDESPEPETDTVYATLDLGTQSSTIATVINEGDTYEVTDSNSLTISDLYVTPNGDGRPRVLARVALTGQLSDQYEGISYDGAPPRLGRTLEIVTGEYRVDGRISVHLGMLRLSHRTRQRSLSLIDSLAALHRRLLSAMQFVLLDERLALLRILRYTRLMIQMRIKCMRNSMSRQHNDKANSDLGEAC